MTSEEFRSRLAECMATGNHELAVRLALDYAAEPNAIEDVLADFCRWLLAERQVQHAEAILDRALAANPERKILCIVEVELLILQRDIGAALATCDELVSKHPDNAEFLAMRGATLRDAGQIEDAKASLRAALERDPFSCWAHFQLSSMIKYDKAMPEYKALLAASTQISTAVPSDLALLYAALGKAHEDCGDFDDAFEAYQRFNGIQRQTDSYVEDIWAAETTAMPQVYSKALLAADIAAGPSTAEPIFVFGLPRSGTTLTEQILARHSQTNAIGETEVIPPAYNEWLRKWAGPHGLVQPDVLTQDALADAADMILSRNAQFGTGGGPRIVDKSLSNFRYLGFLHYVFPKARFVYCLRNPLDVAMSCYATFFGPGIGWTNDLTDIGRFMRRHQKLMKYWRDSLPHPIHKVRYEDMVGDPETHARALLDACGLPWEASCLEVSETKRPIYTASVVQARQPIYKTSMGRAARFDHHLGGLKATLGKAANADWFDQ